MNHTAKIIPGMFAAPAAVIAALLFSAITGSAAGQSVPALVRNADLHYRQKSYAAALKEYESAEQAGQIPDRLRDEADYRIAVSLGKTQQWDRALETSLRFAKTHRGTIWEPRGLYWLGRLYLAAPGEGYRSSGKVFRSRNQALPNGVVAAKGNEKPLKVSLAEQDRRDALEALEAARILYSRMPAGAAAPEQVQLDFDLAYVLNSDPRFPIWGQARKWLPPNDPDWRVDPAQVYSLDWAPPKKTMYLYAHIQRLAATPGAHSAVLALLDKALWLQQYQGQMRGQYAIRWENLGRADEKQVPIPFPYQDVQPQDILRQAIRQFPQDRITDQVRFILANLLQQDGKMSAALEEYQNLIRVHPKSKWVSDARQQIASLTHRTLSVNAAGLLISDRPAKVNVTTRNLTRLQFRLYKVTPESWIGRASFLRKPDAMLTDCSSIFGGLKRFEKKLGTPAVQWDRDVPDPRDYQAHNTVVTLPTGKTGAYVLIASGQGVRSANLLFVTDLVLVQKNERDHALFYAVDARTGHPMAGVNVLAKEWHDEQKPGGESVTRSRGIRATTNAEGIVSIPLARTAGRRNFQMAALAFRNGAYALTQSLGFNDWNENHGRYKSLCTTDRAVYRPFQTVRYRDLVMEHAKEGLRPVAGRQIHVEVTDAQGRRIYARLITSSEFGSVNGSFELPAGAPLGEYAINCSVYKAENDATETGGNQFRVEEYKKPEFEVTVAPEAERVRLGQPTSAKIAAKYYFGGPVAGATVSYRVYRNSYAQSYVFPQAFDFLYANSSQGQYNTNFRNGEVIAQGTARTDDRGEAKVTFPTQAEGARWYDQDLSYTIEADVKDSSRRTITGTGAVKATRHDVAVFLNYPKGYATKGDRLDVEIVTLNPSDLPVSVEGIAKVFRQSKDPKGKETPAFQQPLVTDAHGRAYLKWTADRAGYYRIAFVTRDTTGAEVHGDTFVWVQGPELAKGDFHTRGIFLAVQNPYYEEGQAAKVLIATEAPDCAVLLTREVNNQILEKSVVHISGHSLEVSLPLMHRDVPNVYVSAVMVRNGELFQASQEIFVPPVSQLAKVSVEADREKYQPGEKAKFRLSATDWHNRPLRTELAVSISDAALSYIQKDYSPDIRVYYYGDRRSESISSGGSVDVAFQEIEEDTQQTPAYTTHQLLMPEGMGLLNDWPPQNENEISGRRSVRRWVWPAMSQNGRSAYDSAGILTDASNMPAGMAYAVTSAGRVSHSMAGRSVSVMSTLHGRVEMQPADASPGPAGPVAPAALRSNFVDTAFWTPAVVTDAQGSASVEVTWPDNLTQWRAHAIGSSVRAQVGTSETRVTTRKDLLVRLEAPRYFVERDTMTISAIVQNYTGEAAHVHVRLDLDGSTLQVVRADQIDSGRTAPLNGTVPGAGLPGKNDAAKDDPMTVWVDVPSDGEKRVDWQVHVVKEGEARIRMTAQGAKAGDATEMTFPVLIHGVERAVAKTGVLRGSDTHASVSIELPEARKAGSSELVVQLNPSLAAVMLDALPYLNAYPYGCVEQTMSRFLPSVVTAHTLKDQGYKLEDLRKRMQALARQAQVGRGNLEVSGSPYTYPKGKPGVELSRLEPQAARWEDPVFDTQKLNKMIAAGLARLYDFQHEDGGWGWWKADQSDPYMSSYVLYGLLQARDAGVEVDADRMRRGLAFLLKRFKEEDSLHLLACEARTLALDPDSRAAIRPIVSGRLYNGRERLSAYSKALLALALNSVGEKDRAVVLLRNLENTVRTDEANGTANWGESDTYWWRWYNDQVETNATVLQAYMAIQPGAKIPPMLVKWLVNHRQGSNWSSTRETAITVYALSDYIRANKELAPDYTLTVDLGGRLRRTYKVNRENALLFDNRFVVPDELLHTGAQELTITRQGPGACYYGAYTRYFSREDSIPASGNEIFVTRRYFRLLPGTASGEPEATPVVLDRPNPFLAGRYDLLEEIGTPDGVLDTNEGPRYERTALADGDTVTSGDLLEVELQLEAKNDYEYLAFEDLKPAGCEPFEVRSGEKSGEGVYANMELRDQKVVFFITQLNQGHRLLSYRLRAEAPGQFHVLPTNGYAMYAPAVRTLSDELKFKIKEE